MAPFKFSYVTQLFDEFEKLELHEIPLTIKDKRIRRRDIVNDWFRSHRLRLDFPETNLAAILSTLFPHRRPDRVYNIQHKRLSQIISRCLNLGKDRMQILSEYTTPGKGDLGACLERVLRQTAADPRPGDALNVDEIDEALTEIASGTSFSSPKIRLTAPNEKRLNHEILVNILGRASPVEGRWLVRLILKDLSPVLLDDYQAKQILVQFHFLLPGLLNFREDLLETALLLKSDLGYIPRAPPVDLRNDFIKQAEMLVRPTVGIKVGRPEFKKARSIKHCLLMTGDGVWEAERKYDGEYCEIHVDLARKGDEIQIFSKSGKDSTRDRVRLHNAIRESLRIGTSACAFRGSCIVAGEMVVYDAKQKRIAEFHKIRKWVSRSGRYLGAEADSQRNASESLMIVYYDLLMIDDKPIFSSPYSERQKQLSQIIARKRGQAIIAERITIDFSRPEGRERLLKCFSASRYRRQEGLVLKPARLPYASLAVPSSTCRYFIKVKADYMQELGGERDVADFAIIGASYDPKLGQKAKLRKINWTTFHLGCMTNKLSVLQCGHVPQYRVVGSIDLEGCIPSPVLEQLNSEGQFCSRLFSKEHPPDYGIKFGEKSSLSKMDVYFSQPFVVEVLGSGFDKPVNEDIFMLRHPRMLKIHHDRTWKDTVGLEELQDLSDEARKAPEPSQEEKEDTSQRIAHYEARFAGIDSQMTICTPVITPMSTPTSVASTTASPSTGRPRRTPNSNTTPPFLIRVDTRERLNLTETRSANNADKGKSIVRKSVKVLSLSDEYGQKVMQPTESALAFKREIQSRFENGTRTSLLTPPPSGEARHVQNENMRVTEPSRNNNCQRLLPLPVLQSPRGIACNATTPLSPRKRMYEATRESKKRAPAIHSWLSEVTNSAHRVGSPKTKKPRVGDINQDTQASMLCQIEPVGGM